MRIPKHLIAAALFENASIYVATCNAGGGWEEEQVGKMDWDENMQISRSITLKFGRLSSKHTRTFKKCFNQIGSVGPCGPHLKAFKKVSF